MRRLAIPSEEGFYAVSFEKEITKLVAGYLADPRRPNVTGFVDELFRVASEHGALGCAFAGHRRLRFFVQHLPAPAMSRAQEPCAAECIVELAAARSILRMMCARLAVLCKERLTADISLYGDSAVLEYPDTDRRRWSVGFINTPDRQEFVLESW